MKHPDYCLHCEVEFNKARDKRLEEMQTKIWVYTPMGLLLTTSIKAIEQKWLDKGLVVSYLPLSLPEPFEFEIVS